MLKGFKDFIMRGNLIELAVAFVIGAAFANVVMSVVTAIINPLVSSLPGAKVGGLGFSVRGGDLKSATFINISTVVNALIVFLSTAAVVYFALVVPMNKIQERRAARVAAGEEPAEEVAAKTDDVILLEQIRDLLQSQAGGGAHAAPSPRPSA